MHLAKRTAGILIAAAVAVAGCRGSTARTGAVNDAGTPGSAPSASTAGDAGASAAAEVPCPSDLRISAGLAPVAGNAPAGTYVLRLDKSDHRYRTREIDTSLHARVQARLELRADASAVFCSDATYDTTTNRSRHVERDGGGRDSMSTRARRTLRGSWREAGGCLRVSLSHAPDACSAISPGQAAGVAAQDALELACSLATLARDGGAESVVVCALPGEAPSTRWDSDELEGARDWMTLGHPARHVLVLGRRPLVVRYTFGGDEGHVESVTPAE